ncbi:AAA domain containing protein [uncultured Caudovirales phage]|uniref:AAA domain containing protein n=3 Tax=uncultured Caudovirales phage TaxID=2100421 RepID=A0A6J5QXQ5_9CAUD|nr:AAA domain containing protein [uncultured Caudovirales phage]CAB4189544.1 AAA domain containing protein [uncultured Caudovirales phage]CAB4194224.1 AAA domain containing protein [uncultured Caudovirales phage]CAB5231005.1 AAA domain containing protein [uncultured Caudovirales phage]
MQKETTFLDVMAIYRRYRRAGGIDEAEKMARAAISLIRETDQSAVYLLYLEFEANLRTLDKLTPHTYQRVALDDLESLKDVQPRDVLVEGVLRVNEVALLIGAAKANKTWVGIDLALAITEGGRFMGALNCPMAGDVLYLDAESSREMLAERFRLSRLNSPKEIGKLSILCQRGKSPETVTDALDIIAQGISQSQASLCIIDTLSAYFPIANENDNAEATHIMSCLVKVAEDYSCALCIVHHTPKQSGTKRTVVDAAAGAGAYSRRADSIIAVRQEDGENYVDIRCRSFAEIERFVVRYGANMRPQGERCSGITPPVERKRVRRLGQLI